MRAERDQPLERPGTFLGTYPSGAPFIAAADVILPTAQEIITLTGISDLNGAISSWRMTKPERIVAVTDAANAARFLPLRKQNIFLVLSLKKSTRQAQVTLSMPDFCLGSWTATHQWMPPILQMPAVRWP